MPSIHLRFLVQVLVERFKDEILVSDILSNQDGLQGMLLQAFQVGGSTVFDLMETCAALKLCKVSKVGEFTHE